MIEKLKSIVDALHFLELYPGWLKLTLIFWLVFSVSLFGAMIALFPKEEAVQIIRLTLIRNVNGGIGFQLRVKNSSSSQVELTALTLDFYKTEVTTEDGSLQSTDEITGHYIVLQNPTTGELATQLNQEKGLLPATISFPFKECPDYALLSLELAQKIPKKGSDRFEVAIQAANFPPKEAKFVKATIFYDSGKKTKAETLTLPGEN